jgi:hypothetical protein
VSIYNVKNFPGQAPDPIQRKGGEGKGREGMGRERREGMRGDGMGGEVSHPSIPQIKFYD